MFQGHSAGCKFCLGILVIGETYCVTLFVGSFTNTGKQGSVCDRFCGGLCYVFHASKSIF